MVHTDLEITVQCQVDVMSGLRFRPLNDLQDPSHTVHIHGLGTFLSLQFRLHGRLDAGLTDKVCQLVIRVRLPEFFQLIVPYFSDVADDRRKVDAVIVYTDRGLLDSNTL